MSFLSSLLPNKNKRIINQFKKQIHNINREYEKLATLSFAELIDIKKELIERYKQNEANKEKDLYRGITEKAFALVKEVIRREKDIELYDVQLMGGLALHKGSVAEMKTGEGKTYVAPLAAFLNSLSGHPIHIVTVNAYLANRDADLMRDIFKHIDVKVGSIATDDPIQKREAYQCDFVYGTTSDFGFDYLRDNLVLDISEKLQSKHYFAIIDEVDSVLIDEARTPLIISGSPEKTPEYLPLLVQIPPLLEKGIVIDKNSTATGRQEETGDFTLDFKSNNATLTDQGFEKVENILKEMGIIDENDSLANSHNLSLINHVNNAINAAYMYLKDVNYVVKNNDKGKPEVMIIDDNTGRIMEGRRWQGGLHQAVEAKEGIEIQEETRTVATITIQNYFRMYSKLSGMTGTADTEAFELHQVYGMETIVIPTNKPIQRKDNLDIVFLSKKAKENKIVEMIKASYEKGQPVLLGTTSVSENEHYANLLNEVGVPYNVLNAKEHDKEAEIIAQAGKKHAITISTNMAGRGTDIILGGNYAKEIKAIEESDLSDDEKAKQIEEINKQQKAHQDEVIGLGGLHVISTSRNEARRIDNQLRGRAGRQGDVGVSDFVLSFEDELFLRAGMSEKLINLCKMFGIQDGEEIQLKKLTTQFTKAQQAIEGFNFEQRKNLIKFDEILNQQRLEIYKLRDDLLVNDKMVEQVVKIAEQYIEKLVYDFIPKDTFEEEWNIGGLQESLAKIDLRLSDDWNESGDPQHKIIANCVEQLKLRIEYDIAHSDNKEFNDFLRYRCLKSLDERWITLLENVDYLRKGIYLRSYAQKDPVVEFKKESYSIFENFVTLLQEEFLLSLIDTCRNVEHYVRRMQNQTARDELANAISNTINQNPKGLIYLNGLVEVFYPYIEYGPLNYSDNSILINGVENKILEPNIWKIREKLELIH